MALKIGITGHRKLEFPEVVRQSIKDTIQKILLSESENKFVAFSSLAAGSDSIFAEVALESGGELKPILPMPVDEYLIDFDPEDSKLFHDLFARGEDPLVLTDAIPTNREQRDEAYWKAGQWVVDQSDVIIAVWDGKSRNGKGGTADVVNYAQKSGKKLIRIDSYRSDISRLFWKYDEKAIRLKTTYEWLWKISIIFSLSAALTLAVYLSFHLDKLGPVLAKIEFFAVTVALGIILYLKWGKLNRNRVASRRAAERLRVMEKFEKSKCHIEKLNSYDGLPVDVQEVEDKYDRIHYTLKNFEKSKKNLLKLVDEQIRYHSGNRPEIKGKTYHFLETLQFPLLIAFFLGVSIHFIAVLIKEQNEHLSHFLYQAGLLLSLSIPPIYAAIEGYIYFKEYQKIFSDSEKMNSFFLSVQHDLEDLDNKEDLNYERLNECALHIRRIMDAETKEWSIWFGRPRTPGP